jgi:membrane protease subunit HflK
VITADEDRQERINTAEAYEADLIPRTRGEAIARISNAQGDAERIEANAIGFDVWFRSIERNGRKSPRLTRARIAAEATEAALAGSRIIAAPNNVRVWLDGEGHWPREPTLAEEQ